MAVQRLAPDALTLQTNLTGSLANIQDDPDSPDANWLVSTGNTVTTTAHVTFPSPAGALFLGAGLQELRVLVRKDQLGGTGTPTAVVSLYENGTPISNSGSVNVTSTVGQIISLTWDATGRNASLIECRVVGTPSGGSPAVRIAVDVGAIEWNADAAVTVSSIGTGEVVPSPLVYLGLQFIDPAGNIGSGEAFGTASLNLSAAPSGIASQEALPTTAKVSFTVAASGIASTETVPAPAVSLGVSTTGIASSEVVPSPIVMMTISPTGIASAESVPTTASLKFTILATGIASAEVVPVPVATPRLVVTGIASSEVVPAPRTGVPLYPSSIASMESVPSGIISSFRVTAVGVASAEAFGVLLFGDVATPVGIASAEAFGVTDVQAGPALLSVFGIASELVLGTPTIARSPWWNSRYPYRRPVSITTPVDQVAPAGHPIEVFIELTSTMESKFTEDFDDLEVILSTDAETYRRPRVVTQDAETLTVRFLLQQAIPADTTSIYYLYYGDYSPLEPLPFVDNTWPLHAGEGDPIISYTRPAEDWSDGVTDRRGAKATAELQASAIRILANRYPAGGVAEVQLNNGPWESIDLFSPTLVADVEVWSSDVLAPGPYRVRYRSTGHANPSARGARVNLRAIEYRVALSVVTGVEEVHTSAWRVAGVGGGGA